MILMLTLTNGKEVMFDYEDVIVVEELADCTQIRCRRDGLTWDLCVIESINKIYDMLDYEDLHED